MDEPGVSPGIAARPRLRLGERVIAATLLVSHGITHMYSRGFYIIIPLIAQQLGLSYAQTGLLDSARWLASGLGSLGMGFFTDMFQHRRGLFLGLSMAILGVGYFLVGVAPNFVLILMSLALATAGLSMWHPVALGMLSQRFPRHRGLVISLHRSTGSAGEVVGALLVGIALVALTWRQVLQLSMPLAVLLGVVLWAFLWNVGGPKPEPVGLRKNLQGQMAALGQATRGKGLINLLAVSALRGMGDRTLFLFIPLYLSQELKMGTVGVGFHLALLSFFGIASGPIFGALSDRWGRKPMIASVLLISTVFPPLMVLVGAGLGLSITIALFGLFLYSVNSLVQAAAMDIAEGLRLEGTFIGLLWGNNALFGAFSPLLAGALAGWFGIEVAFYYAAGTFLAAALLSLRLPPSTARRQS